MILPFSSRFWVIYIRLQDSNIFLLMPVQDMRLKSGSGDAMDGPAAAKLSPPGGSGGRGGDGGMGGSGSSGTSNPYQGVNGTPSGPTVG